MKRSLNKSSPNDSNNSILEEASNKIKPASNFMDPISSPGLNLVAPSLEVNSSVSTKKTEDYLLKFLGCNEIINFSGVFTPMSTCPNLRLSNNEELLDDILSLCKSVEVTYI